MVAQIFLAIQFLLKLFGLWEEFQNFQDKQKIADAEKNKQDRDNAINEQKNAKDETEFDKDQAVIVDKLPKP